jgi:DNA-binding FadR family transcriptional regulator
MRARLADMATARDACDGVGFVRANWALHARIAEVSPSAILRSFYVSLLDVIESHTLEVSGTDGKPLPEYVAARHQLHERLVDAIEARDRTEALRLIDLHNNSAAAGGPN